MQSNRQSTYSVRQNQVKPTSKVQEKFSVKPKYNDLWATILFLLNMTAFGILFYFGWKRVETETSKNASSNTSSNPIKDIGISLAISSVLSIFINLIYYLLMQKFTEAMIWIGFIVTVMLYVVASAGLFALKQYLAAVITLLLTILLIWVFMSIRHRIPFAKIMLKTVLSIVSQYPATLFTGFLGLAANFGFMIVFVITLAGWILKYKDENKGFNPGLGIFAIFTLYWFFQVSKNVVHVTVCGLVASFYFLAEALPSAPDKFIIPFKNPTLKSAGRALTTSFGSICYGSLIIALIQTVRAIISSLKDQAARDGNLCACFCLICLECIISMIESIALYFNHYAFTQVAIYGKDYCTAGKDTWELVKTRGVDAVINDSLIGFVLGFGGLLVSSLTAIVAYVYLYHISTEKIDDAFKILAIIISFLIGYMEFAIVGEVIESGTACTFVCLAEDPNTLARTKPELYNKIAQVYPEVLLY